MLFCGHTYCCVCLSSWANEGVIVCPEDQMETKAERVDLLPKNYALLNVMAMRVSPQTDFAIKEMKETCDDLASVCKEHCLPYVFFDTQCHCLVTPHFPRAHR